MSRRIKEPAIDETRTQQLGIAELLVQADCGDDFIYCAFPKTNSNPRCPRCGSSDTIVHLTRTRILRDILPDTQEPIRFIELHFTCRSYQCSKCKNVFTPNYEFALPRSRLTRRFEDFLVRESISHSLSDVSEITNSAISPAAIKILIDRWEQEKAVSQPPLYTGETLCLLAYQNSQTLGLLVLTVDNGNIYLADVLSETGSETIRTLLRKMELGKVRQVITDLTESVWEGLEERLPNINRLIDPGTYYSLVQEQLYELAKQKTRWLPMRDKMNVIMTPRKKVLATQQYNLRQILKRRPELATIYNASDGLYEILSTGWSTQRLTQWAESVQKTGPELLIPIAKNLLDHATNIHQYELAGLPAMKFSTISEQLTRYNMQLRPCSFALEKVRLMYLNKPDTIQTEDASIQRLGVPVEKIFETLKELQNEQEGIYTP